MKHLYLCVMAMVLLCVTACNAGADKVEPLNISVLSQDLNMVFPKNMEIKKAETLVSDSWGGVHPSRTLIFTAPTAEINVMLQNAHFTPEGNLHTKIYQCEDNKSIYHQMKATITEINCDTSMQYRDFDYDNGDHHYNPSEKPATENKTNKLPYTFRTLTELVVSKINEQQSIVGIYCP